MYHYLCILAYIKKRKKTTLFQTHLKSVLLIAADCSVSFSPTIHIAWSWYCCLEWSTAVYLASHSLAVAKASFKMDSLSGLSDFLQYFMAVFCLSASMQTHPPFFLPFLPFPFHFLLPLPFFLLFTFFGMLTLLC